MTQLTERTDIWPTENWEVKGKFPQSLKPMLSQLALKAIISGDYNDNFFNLMPKIFPYNRFTMQVRHSTHARPFIADDTTIQKLIKRTIWREHTNLLTDRSNELLKELAQLAQEGFPKAQEEYEKAVILWRK